MYWDSIDSTKRSSLKYFTAFGRVIFDNTTIFIHYKMINLDSITNENNKLLSEKWPYIPDHVCRILITGGFGSGKTNTLLNLINK